MYGVCRVGDQQHFYFLSHFQCTDYYSPFYLSGTYENRYVKLVAKTHYGSRAGFGTIDLEMDGQIIQI